MQRVIDQLKGELQTKKNQLPGLNQEVRKAQRVVAEAEAARDQASGEVAELTEAIAKLEAE